MTRHAFKKVPIWQKGINIMKKEQINRKPPVPEYIVQEIILILDEVLKELKRCKSKNESVISSVCFMRNLLIKRYILRG